jgi:hypothetical protein
MEPDPTAHVSRDDIADAVTQIASSFFVLRLNRKGASEERGIVRGQARRLPCEDGNERPADTGARRDAPLDGRRSFVLHHEAVRLEALVGSP